MECKESFSRELVSGISYEQLDNNLNIAILDQLAYTAGIFSFVHYFQGNQKIGS